MKFWKLWNITKDYQQTLTWSTRPRRKLKSHNHQDISIFWKSPYSLYVLSNRFASSTILRTASSLFSNLHLHSQQSSQLSWPRKLPRTWCTRSNKRTRARNTLKLPWCRAIYRVERLRLKDSVVKMRQLLIKLRA